MAGWLLRLRGRENCRVAVVRADAREKRNIAELATAGRQVGNDTVDEVLELRNIQTACLPHVWNGGGRGVRSPLDRS